MPYRSTDKTRQKKDSKRAAIMQAALRHFAKTGYHSATIRDIVAEAGVAIGTFYFYFPDKETLFAFLYDETADFLLQAIGQAIAGRQGLPEQLGTGVQAYVNIAIYEPAVVHLLLVGSVGAAPALVGRRGRFRERLISTWQRPIDQALDDELIAPQNTRRSAEALTGAFDEVILNLLDRPNAAGEAPGAVADLTHFALQALAFAGA